MDTNEDFSQSKAIKDSINKRMVNQMERCEDGINSDTAVNREIPTRVKYISTKDLRNTKRRRLNSVS